VNLKNILNVGRIWLKFMNEKNPFGVPLRKKRTHNKIAAGDIIQVTNDFYVVHEVGAREIQVYD
jgi:hypothetical protein